MQRRDYLDKQIDQLGRVLAKMLADLIGLKHSGTNAMAVSDVVFRNELGLSVADLLALPETDFIDTLLATGKFNSDNLERLADVLLWQADETQNPETKNNAWRKCLLVYRYIDETDKIFSSERHSKITRLNRLLAKP